MSSSSSTAALHAAAIDKARRGGVEEVLEAIVSVQNSIVPQSVGGVCEPDARFGSGPTIVYNLECPQGAVKANDKQFNSSDFSAPDTFYSIGENPWKKVAEDMARVLGASFQETQPRLTHGSIARALANILRQVQTKCLVEEDSKTYLMQLCRLIGAIAHDDDPKQTYLNCAEIISADIKRYTLLVERNIRQAASIRKYTNLHGSHDSLNQAIAASNITEVKPIFQKGKKRMLSKNRK